MLDLQALTHSIQHNCHISDAQFAGNYTMCVFLLKMREYYRWEKGIPLSHPLPRKEVGEWLIEREQYWDELDALTYSPISINNQQFDPFESEEINRQLLPHGYVYSGGLGMFHKPYFFLGKLEKEENREGITLLVSSEEYARDLVSPPAMLLGETVYIRKESLRRIIWERIDEWRLKKQNDTPMARALACYGHDQNHQGDMETILDQMTENELDSVILHETGEARAKSLLGSEWEDLLTTLPRSKAEFIARAVRDNLADCLITLPTLIESRNEASLHFYFANFSGMRKELFPQALKAYQQWIDTNDLGQLKTVCTYGQTHWRELAQKILGIYKTHSSNLAEDIESLCLLDI